MVNYFKLQKKIAPELIEVIEERYAILRTVYHSQPIGRRSLAQVLDVSERTIRNHLVFLKNADFIITTNSGVKITTSGEEMLKGLDCYVKNLRGTSYLEERLEKLMGLDVYVVPGIANDNQSKDELGRFAADFLKGLISYQDIIAITGGTTLSSMVEMMTSIKKDLDITVVPARGGLGEKVEIQANTIAAKVAKKLNGDYRLLHIPDNLKKDIISKLIKESSIKKVLDLVKEADFLIHGIGIAEVMAKRRGMPTVEIEKLKERGAVGESFGYYFNQSGEIVYSTASFGLELSDLAKIKKVIAVAGGESKAKAILAAVSKLYQDILIVDEEAARRIIDLTN